jgi:phosphoribosylanthranilate isomerase
VRRLFSSTNNHILHIAMDYNTSVIQFYILENKKPIKILRQLQLHININLNDHSPHHCQAQSSHKPRKHNKPVDLMLMTDAYKCSHHRGNTQRFHTKHCLHFLYLLDTQIIHSLSHLNKIFACHLIVLHSLPVSPLI